MKKLTIVLLAAVCLLGLGRSQNVAYYTFKCDTANSGTYTALTAATSIPTSSVAADDFGLTLFNNTTNPKYNDKDTLVDGISIGFDFSMGGKTYDKFVLAGMGHLFLGEKDQAKVKVSMGSSQANYTNSAKSHISAAFMGFRSGLLKKGDLAYKTEGETGSKILTVEYSGLYFKEDKSDSVLRFQIKLFEQDNHIEIIFDGWEYNQTRTGLDLIAAIGIGDHNGNQHYRNINSGFSNTSSTSMRCDADATLSCPEALRYTFTMPAACEAPTMEIASLSLTATSDQVDIEGVFGETGKADAYILFASTSPISLSDLDGKEFKEGDEVSGATVLAVDDISGTSFSATHENLDGNTRYYYAAYLYNYKCTGAKYGTAKKVDTTTLTTAPEAVAVSYIAPTLDTLKINITANAKNEEVLVVLTHWHVANNNYFWNNEGDFQTPSGDLAVGDTVWNEYRRYGGVVIYAGAAGENILCPVSLKVNNAYHVAAFSKRADGVYSTVYAHFDTVTPVRYPYYFDFSNYVIGQYEAWEGNSGFELSDPRHGGSMEARITDGEHFCGIFALPALEFPDDVYTGLYVDFVMPDIAESRIANKPYTWDASDTVFFEASTDNGATFQILKMITMDSRDRSEGEYGVPMKEEYQGKTVLLRFRYVTDANSGSYWGYHSLSLTRFDVLPIGHCATPPHTKITFSDVYGGDVKLDWAASMMGESVWNLQYAFVDEDANYEWNTAIRVTEDETKDYRYQLTGLYTSRMPYVVRLQAECGVGNVSEWSRPVEFITGYAPSLLETFDVYPERFGTGWMKTLARPLPEGWTAYQFNEDLSAANLPDIIPADTLEPLTGYPYKIGLYNYDWLSVDFNNDGNGTLCQVMNATASSAIVLPAIKFEAGTATTLKMKMAFVQNTEDGFVPADTADKNYFVGLFASRDNGATFAMRDTVRTWNNTQIAALDSGVWVEAAMPEFAEGDKVVLMFGIFGKSDNPSQPNNLLFIDSLQILNNCAKARALAVRDLSQTEATLTWMGDITISEWTVKLTTGNEVVVKDSIVEGTVFKFTDLQPGTTYVAYVKGSCDNATEIEFTTAAEICKPVSNITITDITTTSATFSWEGEADNYRIRIRPVAETGKEVDWTIIPVNGAKTYKLNNLLVATRYEGAIQSLCSEAASDTSAYVAFESFSTKAITCFAPTQISATAANYKTVKLAWTGTSAAHRVRYTEAALTTPAYTYVFAGADSLEITELTAQTEYVFQIRGICGEGDTSVWSEAVYATTPQQPDCSVPVNLSVENIGIDKATLKWDVQEACKEFILRFREGDVSAWDSVKNLTAQTYELTGLKSKTTYLWSVMAQCADGRYSGWATQNTFETSEKTANESLEKAGLFVTVGKHQIHLMNPSAVNVNRVKIYSTTGRLLETYTVNSNQNAIFTTAQTKRVVVVSVECGTSVYNFKVLLP